MDINIREVKPVDIEYLINSGWPKINLPELQSYRNDHFTETGERKRSFTGYPEQVWITETGGRVVGYLHFFTDCWDGYEDTIIGLSVDPSLPPEDAKSIKEKLETELRLREP